MKTYQEIEQERNILLEFVNAIENPLENKNHPIDLFHKFNNQTDGLIVIDLKLNYESQIKKSKIILCISSVVFLLAPVIPEVGKYFFGDKLFFDIMLVSLWFLALCGFAVSPLMLLWFDIKAIGWDFEKYIKNISSDKISLLLNLVHQEISSLELMALSDECRIYNEEILSLNQQEEDLKNARNKLSQGFPLPVKILETNNP